MNKAEFISKLPRKVQYESVKTMNLKLFITLTFLTLITVLVQAQQEGLMQADSLKRQFSIETHDTSKVLLLVKITEAYRLSKADSAMLYGNQALELARKINYPKGELLALLVLSVVHRQLGDLPKALNMAHAGLQIVYDNHYEEEEVKGLIRVAAVYVAAKNFPRALSYFTLAEKKLEVVPNSYYRAAVHLFTGWVYEEMNKLDSALHYAQLAYYGMINFEQGDALSDNVFNLLGNIEAKSANTPLARHYYQRGIQTALKNKNYSSASRNYTGVAYLYKKMKLHDSAIYYAKQGLSYGQQLSYEIRILEAANLLAELYEPIDAKETLRYYKIAAAAQQSLYGAEKVQKLQSIVLDVQERQRESEAEKIAYQNRFRQYALLAGLGVVAIIAIILFRNNRQKQTANSLLQWQKNENEKQKSALQQSFDDLQSTQDQLIQSEKMASLGELTAGIAHEMQNPLNFVNNFSEVNTELVEELEQEIDRGNIVEAKAIAADIKENEKKISQHGKRADAIVKSMLQHARRSTGLKEITDINALGDEYLRLSYHGFRAKDKSFNATVQTDFDKSIGNISVISQDIGRVLLNLYNNSFYAVTEKKTQRPENYDPTVFVSTKKMGDQLIMSVKDNGIGITQNALEKIFQPFFTTKPPGEGTGLGLSLSYDIVKAHGGSIKVDSKEGEYSEFIVSLPVL